MNLIPVDPRSLDVLLEVPDQAPGGSSTGEDGQAFEASLLEALFGAPSAEAAEESELPEELMVSPLPARAPSPGFRPSKPVQL